MEWGTWDIDIDSVMAATAAATITTTTHPLYWHFSYACVSSLHAHGAYQFATRHVLSGINMCAHESGG